ncbi:MAG: DUF3194 domain-containing protein [Candidatus Nezhaarchaeales archaeon]
MKKKVEGALPRGGLRDLSITISAERGEEGARLTIEAEVDAHPGVKCDVRALIEEAVAEAFRKADEELSKRGLRAPTEGMAEALERSSR